jgi:hypothetical protein
MQRSAFGRLLPYVGAALLVFVVSSAFHFYYRDNFSTHYPVRALSAVAMRAGELPLWNWHAGGGQPLAGNPNTLSFYPDSILYLALPPRVAFNAHFWLHLIAAFLAMRALVRGLGAPRPAAATAALIYVLSGAVISSTAFYNLVTAAALIPFALHRTHRFMERKSWRDATLLGGAFGLLILAAEPLMIASALLGSVVIAAGSVRGAHLVRGIAAIALAAVIASPLLLAWSEIAGETERSGHRYSTETALAASLPPLRLLEAVTAPFLGFVTDRSDSGYMANAPGARWPPLFISLFLGALVIPAAGSRGIRHATTYRILLVVSLFLALGRFNPAVAALFDAVPQLRIARYPEKFALLATIAGCVLIASWIGEKKPGPWPRFLALAGAVAIVAAAAAAYPGLPPQASARMLASVGIALAALAAAALRGRRHAKTTALLLTIVPLALIHAGAIPLDVAAPYEVAGGPMFGPRVWRLDNGRIDAGTARAEYRIRAASNDPLHGALRSRRFALDRSPEGMYSLLSRVVQERASAAAGPLRLRYARLLGCERIESREKLVDLAPHLQEIAGARGDTVYAYRVDRPLPYAFAPARLLPAPSIQEAVATVESRAFDEQVDAVVPPGVAAAARGAARIVDLRPDGERIGLVVEASDAAVVMINESYFGAWHARAGATELRIFPVNIDRLGILVPRGRTEIDVVFGRQRRAIGFAAALSLLTLALVVFASRRRSRTRTAVPAR